MMSARTGKKLTTAEHIQQSIGIILMTPVGTRLTNRDFGSMVPELIDHAINNGLLLQLQAAIVMALAQWETRIRLDEVVIETHAATATAQITATVIDTGTRENFNVPLGAV